MQFYFLSSILHSLHHFSIFYSNGCDWNWLTMLNTSMNWVNRKRSNRSYKCGNSSILGCHFCTICSICDRLSIGSPLLIINYYLPFNLVFTFLKFIKWPHHYCCRRNISISLNYYPEILLPKPIKSSFWGVGRGDNKVNDSFPLTHLVKFLTGSNLMLLNPSSLAIVAISDITISRTLEPHILGP